MSDQSLTRLISGEDSLPGLYRAAVLHLHMAFPQYLCVGVFGEREKVSERVNPCEGGW